MLALTLLRLLKKFCRLLLMYTTSAIKTEEVAEMPAGQQPEEGETESNDAEETEQQSEEKQAEAMPQAGSNSAGPIEN